MYRYKYPHPAVTADSVIFGFDGLSINVLLIERGGEPYKGAWALPGGFLQMDETVEECARRELREETNIGNVYLEQFHVFSTVGRDPRERVLTVAFFALVSKNDFNVIAGDDASKAQWFEWNDLPRLAFDHAEIIAMARQRLQEKLRVSPIAFKLLGKTFKMDELQRIYELIHERRYDRRNFMRKMESSGFLRKMELSSGHNGRTIAAETRDDAAVSAPPFYGAAVAEDQLPISIDQLPVPQAAPSPAQSAPSSLTETAQARTRYVYSFDEKAFNKAANSREWRKYPFDF